MSFDHGLNTRPESQEGLKHLFLGRIDQRNAPYPESQEGLKHEPLHRYYCGGDKQPESQEGLKHVAPDNVAANQLYCGQNLKKG